MFGKGNRNNPGGRLGTLTVSWGGYAEEGGTT